MKEDLFDFKKINKTAVLGVSAVLLIVILGYRFYMFMYDRGGGAFQGRASLNAGDIVLGNSSDGSNPLNLPVADSFSKSRFYGKSFRYFEYSPKDKYAISVSGECAAAYYSLLIFNARDNYNENPGAARYNVAMPCPSGRKFERIVDLSSLHLTSGTYYFFTADQGNDGPWFNPI